MPIKQIYELYSEFNCLVEIAEQEEKDEAREVKENSGSMLKKRMDNSFDSQGSKDSNDNHQEN